VEEEGPWQEKSIIELSLSIVDDDYDDDYYYYYYYYYY
jgi:hypothetical protein